jgi:hypothetical protein
MMHDVPQASLTLPAGAGRLLTEGLGHTGANACLECFTSAALLLPGTPCYLSAAADAAASALRIASSTFFLTCSACALACSA